MLYLYFFLGLNESIVESTFGLGKKQFLDTSKCFFTSNLQLHKTDNLPNILVFVLAMSLVLWNTGLMGGLRRYNEFGIRLALGESKPKVYNFLLIESIIIGTIGSFIGTILGVSFCYYLQEVGIDFTDELAGASIVMPSILRAHVSIDLFFIIYPPYY